MDCSLVIWRIKTKKKPKKQKPPKKANGVNQRGGKSKQSFCCFCERHESRGQHARPQRAAKSSWTYTPMRSNSRCEEQHKSQMWDYFLRGVVPNSFSNPTLLRNSTLARDTASQRESRMWAGISEPAVELRSEGFHISLQGGEHLLPPLTSHCLRIAGLEVRHNWNVFSQCQHRGLIGQDGGWRTNTGSPSRVVMLKQEEPFEIIQLIPFYGPKGFMTCPRWQSLVAARGREPESLDSWSKACFTSSDCRLVCSVWWGQLVTPTSVDLSDHWSQKGAERIWLTHNNLWPLGEKT